MEVEADDEARAGARPPLMSLFWPWPANFRRRIRSKSADHRPVIRPICMRRRAEKLDLEAAIAIAQQTSGRR